MPVEGDSKGDFRGDFKQDMEGNLLSGLVQVWFSLQLKFNTLELDSEVGISEFQSNSLLGWYQCYCNPMTATSDRGIRHTQRDHFIIILVLFTLQRSDSELPSEPREY